MTATSSVNEPVTVQNSILTSRGIFPFLETKIRKVVVCKKKCTVAETLVVKDVSRDFKIEKQHLKTTGAAKSKAD